MEENTGVEILDKLFDKINCLEKEIKENELLTGYSQVINQLDFLKLKQKEVIDELALINKCNETGEEYASDEHPEENPFIQLVSVLIQGLRELMNIMQDITNNLKVQNITSAIMIFESAKKHLEANPDDMKLAKIVADLEQSGKEAMEELTEEEMNRVLDLHKEIIDNYYKEHPNEK